MVRSINGAVSQTMFGDDECALGRIDVLNENLLLGVVPGFVVRKARKVMECLMTSLGERFSRYQNICFSFVWLYWIFEAKKNPAIT